MNKKCILVVSFGTTHKETLDKNIGLIEENIKDAYKNIEVKRAFTSGMVIKGLEKKGIKVNSVSEALEELVKEEYEEVFIQPTHLIPGDEYDKLCNCVKDYENKFKTIKTGTPLLYLKDEILNVVRVLSEEYKKENNQAIVLMGHGTEHFVNSVYACMDYMFKAIGRDDVYISTVEGYPEIEDAYGFIENKEYKKILLAPLMLVAGDHAVNDMAGDEDSYKTFFEEKGYDVCPILKGIGEYKKVREIYINKIKENWVD